MPRRERGRESKLARSGGTGRKGNIGRKSRTYDNGGLHVQKCVFSEFWHNNNPLEICMVETIPDDKRYSEKTCNMLFPRGRIGSKALTIAISHKDNWLWPDASTGELRLSKKLTTKYYCPSSTCILRRCPYFTRDILVVPNEIHLEDCHLKLIKDQFGFEI